MQIIKADNCGFCFGVNRALEKAYSVANEKNVFTLGELIHNSDVVDDLEKKGIKAIDNINDIGDGSTVIIRSHGIGKDIYAKLSEKNLKIVDATCPFVDKIHKIVEENYSKGKKIIIIGEEKHPEVIGTNGWCDYSAIILNKPLEMPLCDNVEYCVVCQTTFSLELYEKIAESIRNNAKLVEIFSTICYTTIERQKQAQSLSKECDAVFVIGGKHSSNTNKLFEICRQNCSKTFIIENVPDIPSGLANTINKLGITAGASTPYALIEEVVKVMSDSQVKSEQTLNEETVIDNADKTEVTKVVKSPKKSAKVDTMADLMANLDNNSVEIKTNKKLIVNVIKADENGIFVDIGGKKDGFIEKSEATIDENDYNPDNYKVGDKIEAIVIENKNKDKTYITLSKKRADLRVIEQKECEEILKGGEFTVEIEKAVKGGLLSKLGPYTIFVPASQIKIGYVSDLEKYVGKKLRLKMLPEKEKPEVEGEEAVAEEAPKAFGKRIVASQKLILEEERQLKEDKFWSQMVVGTVVSGKVKRFTEFGAFVNVFGHDCLAHISDLSWYKIAEPSEVLELNETYDFVILKADRENNRVSLGFKQLQKKPYELAYEKYPVDSVVKGKVERLFTYGAFVSIDKGVDGLVPVSEISHEWVKDASTALNVGDEIEAKIINFEGTKITLSIKALLPEPEISSYNEEVEEEDAEGDAKAEKRTPKAQKSFERKAPAPKKTKLKKNDEDDIRQWTSDDGNATLGDLLKGLNIEFSEEEK